MSIAKLGITKPLKKSLKFLTIFFLIAVLGFSNLGPAFLNKVGAPELAKNLEVKKAQAATYAIQTGTYVGNGTAKAITGLGFAPQAVIIKPNTAAGVGALLKTTAMPAPNVAYLGAATADLTTGITLNADGFTVDGANTNTANIVHTWIAFTGSDCTTSGVFCVGSYQGTAAAKAVTTGFQPDLVMVKPATAVAPSWRSSSMATNVGQYFANTTQDTTGVLFTTLDATGFTVGATNSPTGVTVYFLAFKAVTNSIAVGTYTGNATDNTNITVSGFTAAPNFVFLKNANAATAVSAMYNVSESYGDNSNYFTDTANLADSIQALQSTGFQVGTNSTANGSGNAIFYAAFGGAAAKSSGSGTFKMATGSYTGTAQVLTVDNLSFKPDLVIIKGGTTAGVFRTSMMGGDSTAYLDSATANITGAITALNPDGFTVGISTAVNTNAVVYYWTAYGNAFNPDNNTGSADFVIGAYYGNGVAAARSLTRMPFQPNLLSIKSASAIGGVFKTSAHTGTITSFYSATADAASGQISSLDANGFTLGTTVTNTNVSATTIWYFGFKSGTNFTVNSYTGTGASQNITTVGFQPDNIWVKRTTAVQGVTRTSSMAADSALPFIAAGNVASAITGIISTGFTVLTATETNASAGAYWYAAWKATVGGPPVPDATSVTYTVSTDGGRSGDSITITGTNFGTVTDGSQANCAGASGTGCVRFIVGGSATVADVDIGNSAWTNTQIVFTVSSTLASNGGVASLQVVAASQSDATPLTFYIYPRISSLSVPTAVADAGREYDSSDSDGLITLNGDHFGTASSTTGYVRILGCDQTTCSSPTGSVEIQTGTACDSGDPSPGDGWSATCIRVRVPTVIADTSYTGSIAMQQGTGGNSKTHTFGNTFRVLPRIISNTPTSDVIGNRVKIAGNHFCQTGTCPVSPNRSTSVDNVKFGSTQALDSDFVNSGASPCSGNAQAWTDAEICVKVPAGTPAGSASTTVTSNTSYTSNAKAFTVQSSVPNDPDLGPGTDKGQFKSDGSTAIGVGSSTNQSTVVFKMLMSVGPNANLEPQVEIASTSASFANSPTATGTAVAYTGTPVTGTVTISGISDNTYHWQGRVRNTGTNEYSNWVSFGGNPETATDFKVDTTAPTITFAPTDDCAGALDSYGSNSATIGWSLNESANGQVEYGISSDLSGSTNYPVPPDATSTSHTITLSNLNSNTTYYYKVKSQDNAGNLATRPSSQPYCNFTTTSVSNPAKTTSFYIIGATSTIAAGSTASTTFSVLAPETSPSVQSAFIVIRGISDSGGTNNIQVWINSQTVKTYAINAASKTYFRIIHKITSSDLYLNDSPQTNVFYISPQNFNLFTTSAKITTTYSYSP